ncbi:FG-GAP-like repeat-containing protein [Plesiomonas shigelloides]|uniref:FG-GAP-like repeat-containing protein n=1 Tax=Plesiomonas shigelloides TaxID=703 RepID=UPI003138F938
MNKIKALALLVCMPHVSIAQSLISSEQNESPHIWSELNKYTVTNNQSSVTGGILLNAYDVEKSLLFIKDYSRQTLSGHGQIEHRGEGVFVYTPDSSGFVGKDSFTVEISDGVNSVEATVKLDVVSGSAMAVPTQFNMVSRIPLGKAMRTAVASADVNGDGTKELVLSRADRTGLIKWYRLGQDTNEWQEGGTLLNTGNVYHTAIRFYDINLDGVDDLLTLNFDSKKQGLYVYYGSRNPETGYLEYLGEPSVVTDLSGNAFIPEGISTSHPNFSLVDYDQNGSVDVIINNNQVYTDQIVFLNQAQPGQLPVLTKEKQSVLYNTSGYHSSTYYFDSQDISVGRIAGCNWCKIDYSKDSYKSAIPLFDEAGVAVDLHKATNGPVFESLDINGDGIYDLVLGGASSTELLISYGKSLDVGEAITTIKNELSHVEPDFVNVINPLSNQFAMHGKISSQQEKDKLYQSIADMVSVLPDLAMDKPQRYNFASYSSQLVIILDHLKPKTKQSRTSIADLFKISGTKRDIFVKYGLLVGDNQQASQGQLSAMLEFFDNHPMGLMFPDTLVSLDKFFRNGGDAFVHRYTSSKNTFGVSITGRSREWRSDLQKPIVEKLGAGADYGNYFTFVLAHEVSHSLAQYVNRPEYNQGQYDYVRRWNQMLSLAADCSPDIKDCNDLSFMRGDIEWFMGARQETLATQANQHWANSEARLVGAIDRWHRNGETGVFNMTANITEVLTFLDFLSVGKNKIPMFHTSYDKENDKVEFGVEYAQLTRNEQGYINSVRMMKSGNFYKFIVNDLGVVTDIVDTSQPEHDFVFPDGLGQYQDGTKVLFNNGEVYQCFGPWAAHCNNEAFAPGVAVDPNWINQQWRRVE